MAHGPLVFVSATPLKQNFVKLCTNEGQNVKMCIFAVNSDLIFFYRTMKTLAKIYYFVQLKCKTCLA